MSYGWCYDPYDRGWGGKVQPGAKVLQDFILERFPTAISFGIIRDRGRCGKSSAHCYGRAGDVGNYEHGRQVDNHPDGSLLADWLIAEAQALGIQRVIWGGEPGQHDWEWDSRPGQRHKSRYHGPSHDDHVHWELCWRAAKELTRAQVQAAYDRYFGKKEWDEMASKEEIQAAIRAEIADLVPEIVRAELGKVKGNGPTDLAHGLSKIHELWVRGRGHTELLQEILDKVGGGATATEIVDELSRRLEPAE